VCAKRSDKLEIVCWGDDYFHYSYSDRKFNYDLLKDNSDIPQITVQNDMAITSGLVDGEGWESMYSSVENIRAGFGFNCGIFTTLSKKSKVVCWGKRNRGQIDVPDFEQYYNDLNINENYNYNV